MVDLHEGTFPSFFQGLRWEEGVDQESLPRRGDPELCSRCEFVCPSVVTALPLS